MNEEKLRTLLILNQRWPRSVIDYNVVGGRVEVIDTQRKVLTVLSTAELERMKSEYLNIRGSSTEYEKGF